MKRVRKHALNCLVAVGSGLPNLAITSGTIFVLTVLFRWPGGFALAAYLIGQVFSVNYSALFGNRTKMKFSAFGREYRYAD